MEPQVQAAVFGETLRKRREALGLDQAAVAQMTRINRPFLDALEKGEFARLPGQVFGRGFLRSIGKALGMTEAERSELIAAYDSCWSPEPAQIDCLKVQIKNKPYPTPTERLRAAANHLAPSKALASALVAIAVVAGLSVGGVSLWPQVKGRLTALAKKSSPKGPDAAETAVSATPAEAAGREPDGGASPDLGEPTSVVDLSAVNAEDSEGAVNPGLDRELHRDMPNAKTATTGDSAAKVDAKPEAAMAAVANAPRSGQAAPAPAVTKSPDASAASAAQTLELVVTEPVRVRLDMDDGQSQTRELTPQTYRFNFKHQADLLIYDAAALKVSFNGRSLGPLGQKGRVRRLSFKAHAPGEHNF